MRTGFKDLFLPLIVVGVVGMMIFPLPTVVLDTLLMCNIAFSLVLLISAVYLSEPEKFTSLPTILLLTTLFRLGLNVSTTRQLLGVGQAPEVVVAFGNFVVSGNLVVGAVIFVIVTLVQFLVIAKGAERVAEVAARFTLDAMPGKQMSIDADVRSGILSLQDARERRLELQRESKLYGALDGSMKFVKGDAIAGLLIIVINIVAGLILGVTQQGLSIEKALHKYTIFTIGDGLVSQIPALLVAVSAGIAVTRVGDKEGNLLGQDLLRQLGKEPQALATTSGVLFLLALVPGLPFLPFLGSSAFFFCAAKFKKKEIAQIEKDKSEADFRPKIFSALVLRLSLEGAKLLKQERVLPLLIQELRNVLFETKGVLVNDFHYDLDSSIDGCAAKIYFHGNCMGQILWGSENELAESFTESVLDLIKNFLNNYLVELIDDTHTRILLEIHGPIAESLINSLIPQAFSVTALTEVLRELVEDGISIRELSQILQSIAEFTLRKSQGNCRGDSVSNELISVVRQSLKRAISQTVADSDWSVQAYTLAPELDHLISKSVQLRVPLDPELTEKLLFKFKELDPIAVILTTSLARSGLAKLIKGESRNLRVLAVEELSFEVKLKVLGEVTIEGIEWSQAENGRNQSKEKLRLVA